MAPRHGSLELSIARHGAPQSHPEETKVIFIGAAMYDDADAESQVPDRSPSLPPGSQHRSCFQPFGKDAH